MATKQTYSGNKTKRLPYLIAEIDQSFHSLQIKSDNWFTVFCCSCSVVDDSCVLFRLPAQCTVLAVQCVRPRPVYRVPHLYQHHLLCPGPSTQQDLPGTAGLRQLVQCTEDGRRQDLQEAVSGGLQLWKPGGSEHSRGVQITVSTCRLS